MLDKSVPHFDILMHRKKGEPLVHFPLPEPFKYRLFKEGDENDWAEIETSVLEFDSEAEALDYFQKTFLPFINEIKRRCLFIEAPSGKKIATTTVWWEYTEKRRDPWIHWVAVHPDYQGLGLGKAIAAKAIELMTEIEGERDFYLHTQTWSHRAVRIYEQLGFEITAEKNLNGFSNDNYEKAVAFRRC